MIGPDRHYSKSLKSSKAAPSLKAWFSHPIIKLTMFSGRLIFALLLSVHILSTAAEESYCYTPCNARDSCIQPYSDQLDACWASRDAGSSNDRLNCQQDCRGIACAGFTICDGRAEACRGADYNTVVPVYVWFDHPAVMRVAKLTSSVPTATASLATQSYRLKLTTTAGLPHQRYLLDVGTTA